MQEVLMRAPDPADAPPLRWGIIGPGFIAGKFTNAVQKHTRSRVVAIGSRDPERAAAFARENGIPTVHAGYDALVADPEVDAVYVATPHSHHREHALLAIAAGKPVLVEKPIAATAAAAREIAEAARKSGVFAMEAMWTRFLPHMVEFHDAVARGDLGEIVQAHAEHSQKFPFDPKHRIYDPALAGGATLDLGVYPLSFLHATLGRPDSVIARGTLAPSGVEDSAAMILEYATGAAVTATTTSRALSGITASVVGTEARASFTGPFLRPTTLVIERLGADPWTFDGEVRNGFQYEIAEVARCVAEGRTESAAHTLDDAIEVLEIIDAVRAQVGAVEVAS